MRIWSGLVVFAVIVTLGLTSAWADEIAGKIQKVDLQQKMIVLEDGTEFWLADDASMDQLAEGRDVTVAYEEQDGKKWVVTIEPR